MKGTNINENRLFNSLGWFPVIGLTLVWFASFLAVYLCDHFGCRITCFMGGILCIAGLLATSFAKSPTFNNNFQFTKLSVLDFFPSTEAIVSGTRPKSAFWQTRLPEVDSLGNVSAAY